MFCAGIKNSTSEFFGENRCYQCGNTRYFCTYFNRKRGKVQMESSMEIKIQAIDKMLELRKQIIDMQDKLGVYNGLGESDCVLIYNTEDFFEMARRVKERVSTGNIASNGMISIMFSYNGVLFNTFIWPREYQLHEDEIDRGETDA